ncbi:hypothetical protein ACFL7M_13695 [Thermodesulfobacteriota bacterium]
MTNEETLKRKIFLKGQLIEIVKDEIRELEQKLKDLKKNDKAVD